MKFTVDLGAGEQIEFECTDTFASRWVNTDILRGKTYAHLPFVDGVQTILDVGANCGAATVHFARHHPDATVHAFEPASETRAYLERNVARLPNVAVHPFGLHSEDLSVPLYMGREDSGQASIHRRAVNSEESEPVLLRAAGAWAVETGIDRIDILKVDVEGCEVEVVSSLAQLLDTVKICYVEYDSRQARRDLADLLDPTHELLAGVVLLDQGELCYLRRDIAERDVVTEWLRERFRGANADRDRG